MPASTFLSVFAKSPIKPIEEHIRKVHQASELLLPFVDAVYQQDWSAAADVRKNIVALALVIWFSTAAGTSTSQSSSSSSELVTDCAPGKPSR